MRVSTPRRGLATLSALPIVMLLITASGCSIQKLPVSPEAISPSPAAGRPSNQMVVVTLRDGEDAQLVASQHRALLLSNSWKVAVLRPTGVQTTDGLIDELAMDPRVLASERNIVVETAETRQESFAFDQSSGTPQQCTSQPSTSSIGLASAQAVSRGAGMLIAIVDTGIDSSHPLFAGSVVGGWDFVNDDSNASDSGDGLDNDGDGRIDEATGHGTHVAGIAHVVAPDASILSVRVLDSDGRGDMANVARGIRWAMAMGARVINLSLGSLSASSSVQSALQDASNAGVVCVSSAGNWGAPLPEEYPAASRYTIAVAAIDPTDHLAPFSSYGSFVGICAPGVGIRSSYTSWTYAAWSGTSMSAPYVTGTVALLLSRHPDWNQKRSYDRLSMTARNILPLNLGMTGLIGAGALDAGAALQADLP